MTNNKVVLLLESCLDCPYSKTNIGKLHYGSNRRYEFDLVCSAYNDKLIMPYDYITKDVDTGIPDWCPLLNKNETVD